jgi:DNA-directed RNA polymerase subunit RPC12/RpoP
LVRLKCSKCNNVFETDTISAMLRGTGLLNLGPYRLLKCPACGKRSLFKFFTSINEPVTWPKPEETQEAQPMMSEEEIEKKRIEDSKYERNQN